MTKYPYIIILTEEEYKITIHEMIGAMTVKSSNPNVLDKILDKLQLADKIQFLLNEQKE